MREVRVHKNEGVFVGVDVSKAHLDVAVHGEVEVRRVVNDEQGIQGLVAELVEMSPALVVLEAPEDSRCLRPRRSQPLRSR